jgi:ketol-acid reductoisomerase
MAHIDFGGTVEEVITSEEFTLQRAREVLEKETVAVLGYGVQGPGQALNMRDNGIAVIVGQREGTASWDKAVADGFVPGETLFPSRKPPKRPPSSSTCSPMPPRWPCGPAIKACLNDGDALYFSHGFGIVYRDQTGIIPPETVDVILAAPKGSGTTVRTNFLDGSGINSSYAVHQDYTGRAKERTLALGIAIGSGYLFPTTFEKEVYSDLTGERGVLMGCLAGVMEAQYNRAAKKWPQPQRSLQRDGGRTDPEPDPAGRPKTAWTGCTPTAAPPPSAVPWTGPPLSGCRGAGFRAALRSVINGEETRRTLECNSAPGLPGKLDAELGHPQLGNVAGRCRRSRLGRKIGANKGSWSGPTYPVPRRSSVGRETMEPILIYDTTLRDGTQGENVTFTADEKLKIAKKLDEMGIHYIEGGWPGIQSPGHALF